jgi:four helix bundle protein
MRFDIKERSFRFAVKAAKFTEELPRKQSTVEYARQLIRSSASVGANVEEADGALSKRDFINKIGIARKEARETTYWLQLIKEVDSFGTENARVELDWLIGESDELRLILSSIINKARNRF